MTTLQKHNCATQSSQQPDQAFCGCQKWYERHFYIAVLQSKPLTGGEGHQVLNMDDPPRKQNNVQENKCFYLLSSQAQKIVYSDLLGFISCFENSYPIQHQNLLIDNYV